MRAYSTEEAIIQNLKDAGCSDRTIADVLAKLAAHQKTDGLKLLAEHRLALLVALHQDQKCIDCLDYLIYDISRSHTT